MCDGLEEIAPPRDAGQRGAALKAPLLFSVRDVAKWERAVEAGRHAFA